MSGMFTAEDEIDGKEFLDLGAFAFFNKPFKINEVEDAVERAIARHQELASADQSGDIPETEEDTTGSEAARDNESST